MDNSGIKQVSGLRKKIIITLISSLLCFFVLLICEFFAAIMVIHYTHNMLEPFKIPDKKTFIEYVKEIDYNNLKTFDALNSNIKREDEEGSNSGNFPYYKFRAPVGLEYKKRPVIFLGCSFAYGMGLENPQTISYKVSKYTYRPVYNYSLPGGGVQHTLWMLNNSKRFDEIKNPEYAIFIFIDDHFRRSLSAFPFLNYPYSESLYVIRGGKVYPECKLKQILYRSYLYRLLCSKFGTFKYVSPIFQNYREDRIVAFFKEEEKILKQKYPNIKFVVMTFPDSTNKVESLKQKIENEGICVVDGFEIFEKETHTEFSHQDEYFLDNGHPNEKMFSLFVPELAKQLNL